ncbi:NADPH-dependent FMN reductase [Jiangella rhizosphaerae]|uniref:NADPH-dependent oxidoreductase n=1 Tax=Jiangella rhizosphaerae TaxID=2293569 RepID=A0A418KV90_9ACTN|nr:NAD(P)H-dependent oxidoreductase [Jiangella rhizosphaerae]RIQ32485.1 NADPH-dependent oxidoreductase [Jiangella rhizosphaerae]
MTRIAIIIGSTRPDRVGPAVAHWLLDLAEQRGDADYEVVDLADFDLPHLDEPLPAATGRYTRPHTLRLAETVAGFDGFVFVTPEYNRSYPGVLKTAIDLVYAEWHHKAAGFVGYGADGGIRAVEHLRGVMGMLQVADVRGQVTLSVYDDFEDFTRPTPRERQVAAAGTMLGEVVTWAAALAPLRAATAA